MAVVVLSLSTVSSAQIAVGVSVGIGPPPLPVYAQPVCPGPGYLWTPGYWAWNDDDGYYWVPGTWVIAPVGLLWTPGWWGWGGGFYVWHAGYWGPHVGFYGGINYGYGYGGVGFVGGEWRDRAFYYNRSVTNVSVTNVTNVYNKTVIVNNTTVNNVSYNGGTGGLKALPTPQEQMAEREQHTAPLAVQTQHQTVASQNKQNFATVNQGKPAIAATAKAADFSSRSVVSARSAGGEYHAPTISPKEARGPSMPANRPFTPVNPNNMNRAAGNTTPVTQNKSNQGFRPFTAPNASGPQKTQAGGNSTPTPQNKSNQGFRPFTPSNASNAPKTPMGGKSSPVPQNKSNQEFRPFTPPNASNAPKTQMGGNSSPVPQNKSKQEFRPFTQPSSNNPQNKGGAANSMNQENRRNGSNPLYESKGSTVRAPSNPPNQPRPQSHPVPQQSRPGPPPPQKQNPAKEDHRQGRG